MNHRDWKWNATASSRKGASLPIALEKGKPTQLFRPGGGRGELMQFYRFWEPSETELSIGLLVEAEKGQSVTFTLALSNAEERPWLEIKKWSQPRGKWQHENFSLGHLALDKQEQCDRLILEIETNLDLVLIYLDEKGSYILQDLGELEAEDLEKEKET